jgi:hypothetical protein
MTQFSPETRNRLESLSRQRQKDRENDFDNNTLKTDTFKRQSVIQCHNNHTDNYSNRDFDLLRLPSHDLQNPVQSNKLPQTNSKNEEKEVKSATVSPLVKEFPSVVDGGKVEEIVTVENPVMRVVHIRQYHAIDTEKFKSELIEAGVNNSKELNELFKVYQRDLDQLVKQSQSEIKQIESDLAENHGVKDIYLEGITVQIKSKPNADLVIRNIDKIIEMAKNDQLDLEKKLGNPNISDVEKAQLEAQLKLTSDNYKDFMHSKKGFGATGEMFKDGKIENIRAVEDETLLRKHLENMGRRMEGEYMERREDFSLLHASEIEKEDDGIATVVLGSAHSYENNVRAWNKLYPDQQIALTVITPHSTDEISKRSKMVGNNHIKRILELAKTQMEN